MVCAAQHDMTDGFVVCERAPHGADVAHFAMDAKGRTVRWSVRPLPCAICGAEMADVAEEGKPVEFRTIGSDFTDDTAVVCSTDCAIDWQDAKRAESEQEADWLAYVGSYDG